VQHGTGERRAYDRFLRTALLNASPPVLLAALRKLTSNHQRVIKKYAEYLNIIWCKTGIGFDLLFHAGYKRIGKIFTKAEQPSLSQANHLSLLVKHTFTKFTGVVSIETGNV
jgi:hypothetical protein